MAQDRVFVFVNGCKIDSFGCERLRRGKIIFRDQTFADQFFGTDEQRVAGKRRVARVRRIAIAGWPKRQYLPKALPRGFEEIREGVSFRPEIANAERPRQRSRMKQNAAGSGKVHFNFSGLARSRFEERSFS